MKNAYEISHDPTVVQQWKRKIQFIKEKKREWKVKKKFEWLPSLTSVTVYHFHFLFLFFFYSLKNSTSSIRSNVVVFFYAMTCNLQLKIYIQKKKSWMSLDNMWHFKLKKIFISLSLSLSYTTHVFFQIIIITIMK